MKRCLLDMDGVLVDFVGGACRLHDKPDPYLFSANHGDGDMPTLLGMSREDFYAPLGEEFWASLRPTPECSPMVEHLERAFGRENVCILTSPVLTHGCYEGKLRWIRQYLPQYARRFLVGPAKEFAAGPDTWLVDDSDLNLERFREWGGNTFQVPRPWNRQHKLSAYVLAALRANVPVAGGLAVAA